MHTSSTFLDALVTFFSQASLFCHRDRSCFDYWGDVSTKASLLCQHRISVLAIGGMVCATGGILSCENMAHASAALFAPFLLCRFPFSFFPRQRQSAFESRTEESRLQIDTPEPALAAFLSLIPSVCSLPPGFLRFVGPTITSAPCEVCPLSVYRLLFLLLQIPQVHLVCPRVREEQWR